VSTTTHNATAFEFWINSFPNECSTASWRLWEDFWSTFEARSEPLTTPTLDAPALLIELFLLGVTALTAEALRAIIGWKSAILLQRGPVDPKFQVGVAHSPPTNHFSSRKTRLNYLSYGIKIWTDLSSVLSQYTRVTDGRTDRRTEFSSLYHVCIA